MLSPGDSFAGRFVIERELGRGGFAVVYLARDAGGGQVALKVLTPGPDGTYERELFRRFMRECDVLRSLSHPGIVRMFDTGEADGLLFLATEFVPGADLAVLLHERERLSAPEVVHILMQLLSALSTAHRQGLIHRDIKPENVRVSPTPEDPLRVKLLDFGIARPTDDGAPALTKTGELIGTPRYMAPEQLTNRPATPASDIYALGIVGYELLLGRDALHGPGWGDQLERIRTQHVVAVTHQDEITPRLREILQRMTAVKPADRFASAEAVMHAITSPAPIRPAPATVVDQVSAEEAVTNQRLALVAVLILLLAAIAYFVVTQLQTDEPPPASPPTRVVNQPQPERSPVAPPPKLAQPGDMGVDAAYEMPASASEGCRSRPPHGGVQGASFVPGSCRGRACPLVLAFHGNFMDPADWLEEGGLADLAEAQGFVIFAPFGGSLGTAWRQSPELNVAAATSAYEDALERFCVDRRRVYLLGYSDGTDAVAQCSCEPWVTAAAAFGLAFSKSMDPKQAPGFTCQNRERPFLWIHPTSSAQVPFESGPTCTARDQLKLGYKDTTGFLRELHGCKTPASATDWVANTTCERWACRTPLMACAAVGGRVWPGLELSPLDSIGAGCERATNAQADIGAAMWRFFESTEPLPGDEGDAD